MTKKNRKVFIVGYYCGADYCNWMESEVVYDMKEADFVCFSGGEDVSPSLYHQKAHPTISANPFRDAVEIKAFKQALALHKPMLGICRGAQFLCVMAGGTLVQDQNNPAFVHPVKTYDNKKVLVSSTHHNAQYPWGLSKDEFKVIAWTENHSSFHKNGEDKEIVNGIVPNNMEVDIAYYPKIRALGIQNHPEMLYEHRFQDQRIQESIEYSRGILTKLLNNSF
jgi:gamma-glutamyl-gamma-aminobutyrate hydrolase PuuD